MKNFNPPKIKKNNNKYKPKDILVLNELNKRPTYVNNPLNTFSGHKHGREEFYNYIDFTEVVSNLRDKELIRENLPKEILKHLTIPELKPILKIISKPVKGLKSELIKSIETYASDTDISSNTNKSCFILTKLGLELLNKYENVVWIANHKEYIFTYPIFNKSKFDEYFFMKHWNVDPAEVMIDYYESKDSGIVARIYQIKKNPEKVFSYGIRKLSEDINLLIENCKENGGYTRYIYTGEFELMDIKSILKSLSISDKSLHDNLNYIYNFSIKNPSLLTFKNYEEIIISALNDERKLFKIKIDDLLNSIRLKFGHEIFDHEFSGKKLIQSRESEKEFYMRSFSEVEVEKWIKNQDENVLPKEEFLGRCFACGEFLSELELPEGPEKKVVCLKDRDYFLESYEESQKFGEIE